MMGKVVLALALIAVCASADFSDEYVPETELAEHHVGLKLHKHVGLTIKHKPSAAPVVYQHCNFGGYKKVLRHSTNWVRKLGIKNDDLSSIKVPAGKCVVLYQHAHYRGKSWKICGTMSRPKNISCFVHHKMLGGKTWNDQVSSIKVLSATASRRAITGHAAAKKRAHHARKARKERSAKAYHRRFISKKKERARKAQKRRHEQTNKHARRKNERASKKKRASKKRERAAKKTTKVALEKKNKARKKRERRNKHLHRKRLTAKKAKRLHVKINAIKYGYRLTKNAMALKVFATMTADEIADYSSKVGILGELLKKMMLKSKHSAVEQYARIVRGMQKRGPKGLEKYMLRHIRKRMHWHKGGIISYGTKGKRAQVDGRVLGLKHGFKVLKKISTPAHTFFKALVKAQMAENKKKARAVHFTKADFEALKNW